MQCFNCRFENMPGIIVCGRCGTSLQVATAVIDVHPPRARPWSKRLRRLLPIDRAAIRVRDASSAVTRGAKLAAQDVGMPVPPADVLVRFLVPGLAHFHLGQRLRGRAFLGAYAALLGLAALFWGTMIGSICLGLAFSAHASSAIDIIFQCPGRIGSRLLIGGAVMAVLGLGLYLPVTQGLSQIIETRTMAAEIPPFAEGDVLLLNRVAYYWSPPKPGDVVMFGLPLNVNIRTRRILFLNERTQTREAIDRILAGPGAEVALKDGELLIDGAKPAWESLNPLRIPNFSLTLPEGCYFILPTMLGNVSGDKRLESADTWKWMSVVPRARVLGKLAFRNQPLWRFWWVR